MKVFLTGATGFVGRHLLTRLLSEGHEVTALVRDPAKLDAQAGLTIVEGTLQKIERWQNSLVGQDAIIHLASPVVFWGKWSFFEDNIVRPSVLLHQLARQYRVPRFIYISSESVIQNRKALLNIDESYPYIKPNSHYGKAKQRVEQRLLAADGALVTTIIRPTFIWGPGVPALATMLDKVKRGQFVWLSKGRAMMEWVHVDNVVEAIVLALNKAQKSAVYYVTDDDPRPVRSVLSDLMATQGVNPPKKSLPAFLVGKLAGVVEFIWKCLPTRSPPPISRFEWSFVALPRRYNISRIKSELGYRPVVSRAEGLAEMWRHDGQA